MPNVNYSFQINFVDFLAQEKPMWISSSGREFQIMPSYLNDLFINLGK